MATASVQAAPSARASVEFFECHIPARHYGYFDDLSVARTSCKVGRVIAIKWAAHRSRCEPAGDPGGPRVKRCHLTYGRRFLCSSRTREGDGFRDTTCKAGGGKYVVFAVSP